MNWGSVCVSTVIEAGVQLEPRQSLASVIAVRQALSWETLG